MEIIIVDDGSPVPAAPEIDGLIFASPFSVKLITQANGGVASARNAGLYALDAACDYIAFLDSDDSWREGHIECAIAALEQGSDLYFCDNRREGVHESHFASAGFDRRDIIASLIGHCPAQTSTVVYWRACAQTLRFDTSLTHAGEDKLFIVQLASLADGIAVSDVIGVDCGLGVNMYFSHLSWDSPNNIAQVIDDLRAHYRIQKTPVISYANDVAIARLRRKLAFLCLRRLIRNKRWPVELGLLAREDASVFAWFPLCAVQVAVGRALRLYSPA